MKATSQRTANRGRRLMHGGGAAAAVRGAARARILAALTCVAACGLARAQAPAAAPRPQSLPPIQARLVIREDNRDTMINRNVVLLGRTSQMLLAQVSQSGAEPILLNKAQVIRCEFTFDYDRAALTTALWDNDWAAAVRTLAPDVRLALPYLDLTDNNGFELAMDLGMYMVSSAEREMRGAAGDDARARALTQYEAAYEVFRYAGRADWTPLAPVAILKGCRALLALGRDEQAAGNLKRIEDPVPGDPTYGHYWLVQAELLRRAGKTREALEAVVKSVVFADKDAETFPSALLLSADCYAALGEHHRARDVYYEVAVLFTGTDWSADALVGLKTIMDGQKTREAEKQTIENVFFNVTEDMNKLAEELLEARAQPEPAVSEPDTEIDF